MGVIISPKNKEKIEAMMEMAQAKCTARTIAYEDVTDSIDVIDKRWRYITMKSREDCRFEVTPYAQKVANSYKYTPMATAFDLMFHGGTWRVTSFYRVDCNRVKRYHASHLSEDTRLALSSMMDDF